MRVRKKISYAIVLIVLFFGACINYNKNKVFIGSWKGMMETSCPDNDRSVKDSILLHFDNDDKITMTKTSSNSIYVSTYGVSEDQIYVESMFGSKEEWLNINPFEEGEVVYLNTFDGGCESELHIFREKVRH